MPIANCILSSSVAQSCDHPSDLIAKWGHHSGVDTSEMTVTVVRAEQQMGKEYKAICTLHLPSVWSPKSVDLLQVGLAKAISEQFELKVADVIVMTSIIQSGHVVEGGEVVSW